MRQINYGYDIKFLKYLKTKHQGALRLRFRK